MGAKCCRPELDEYEGNDGQTTMGQGIQKPMMNGPNMGKKRNTDSESSIKKEEEEEQDDQELDGPAENLLQPGKKVSKDDFIILKVIGRGSFGKVYLVRHKETQLPYAMKILKKDQLIKKNLLIKTQAERDILEKVKNPYIVGLHYAFQTETKLYFIIDFLNGGELFTYLRKEQRFNETRAKIYSAEIIDAIGNLHSNGIIYRDLKPENVLLDKDGHIRITDFGLSKQGLGSNELTYSFCGTPEYLAPEIIKGTGHGRGADWWSLGALLYEMLCGRPPHYNKDRQQMLRDIVEKPIAMKPYFTENAQSLLKVLLERDPKKRIGYSDEDADELKRHPFFEEINWDQISKMEYETAFKPKVKGAEDVSCIDKLFTREGLEETYVDPSALNGQQKNQTNFQNFTYAQQSNM